jgi:signal transduction histidine kinase
MKRPMLAWTIFSAAVAVALGVMLYFTVEMLAFERSMAQAQAHAALEETVRLALWRMDSTAAVLLHQKSEFPELTNKNSAIPQQNVAQRFEPEAQQAISSNEMQLRQSLEQSPATDWHKIAPVLLDRISDILPGATLEDTTDRTRSPTDTRLLATIPARLIVPASALPDSSLPWNTPARISLMIAWGCVLLAAGALARLLAATMSLSSRRGAFASAVTHELRTPLTTFRMYAEMLASGMVGDEAKRRQYLDTLVAEADRLGHLIENVLAYSRLENRLAPRRAMAEMTIEQLIQNALPALRRRVDQAGLSLNVNIANSTVVCRTDPVAVGQILINLVDNACKYGLTAIELCALAAGEKLEIRVTDHGPGVAADRAGRLFSAFSKSKTDSIPGIGLGLYVSRQLARDLGGDLQHSPSGAGTTFVLALPSAAQSI